jgi:hypothetical protein
MQKGLIVNFNKIDNNTVSLEKYRLSLKGKQNNCQKFKLKTRASVETEKEAKMQKCLSCISQKILNAKRYPTLNPEENRTCIDMLGLDLKGKLTDQRWKPICHKNRN